MPGNTLVIRGNKRYKNSKNIKYIRYCNKCKKEYFGWGKYFCSIECSKRQQPKLNKSHSWKGHNITIRSGRSRAYNIFISQPCEICGNSKIDRCHLSGDTRDNSVKNVLFLCRKHHFAIDIPVHLRIYNRPHTSSERVLERKLLYASLKQKRQERGLPLGNLPRLVFQKKGLE